MIATLSKTARRSASAPAPAASECPHLCANGLHLRYPGQPAEALRGVDLRVSGGEMALVTGSNGAGKSSLLRSLAGLMVPSAGAVQKTPAAARIAYLAQSPEIDWNFPVQAGRFVQPRRPSAWPFARRQSDAAEAALAALDLAALAQRPIRELSGGERQRLRLARALAARAQIYLLDEPLNGVDAASRRILVDTLDRLRTQGCLLLIAAHEPPAAYGRPDYCLRMEAGRIVAREEIG